MDLIFLIGAVQALFLALIAFWKKERRTGDIMLAIWIAFMGLHLLNHYLSTTGFLFDHPHLLNIGICFPMLEGPLMYWYVQVMVNETGRFRTKYLLHTIPFLTYTIYFFFDFYFLSAEQKLTYYHSNILSPHGIFKLMYILNVSIGPIYVIWSIWLLSNFKRSLANKFSYTEKISLDWLKFILWGLGLVWITVIITSFFDLFPTPEEGNPTADIIYLSVVIAVFVIGVYGIKQQAILKSIPGSDFKSVSAQRKKSVNELNNELRDADVDPDTEKKLTSLIKYMENEKPYLNPELNIGELANSLNMHSHQLSKFINNSLSKNFFEFVNEFRIQEFKRNVTDPKNRHISILGIAIDAGFNSKASFNRIFKNSTGQTPSQFRDNFKF